jgi:hypothetical protein
MFVFAVLADSGYGPAITEVLVGLTLQMKLSNQAKLNPYLQMTQTGKSTTADCRGQYIAAHGGVAQLKCALTGLEANTANGGELVKVAHIIPRSTSLHILNHLKIFNVNDVKNLLPLADGVEHAFDRLMLSFVPVLGPGLHTTYKVKVWNETCLDWPVFRQSKNPYGQRFLKEFVNCQLSVNLSLVYKRALAFQALWASNYNNNGKLTDRPGTLGDTSSLNAEEWGNVRASCFASPLAPTLFAADALNSIRCEVAQEDSEEEEPHRGDQAPVVRARQSKKSGRKRAKGKRGAAVVPPESTCAHLCDDCGKSFATSEGLRDHCTVKGKHS